MRTKLARATRPLRGLERLERRLLLAAGTEPALELEVQSVSGPDEVLPGGNVFFRWRVDLTSDFEPQESWTDLLYISDDNVLDPSDTVVGDRHIAPGSIRTDSEGQRYYEADDAVFWSYGDAFLFVVANSDATPLDTEHPAVFTTLIEVPKDHDAVIRDVNVSPELSIGQRMQYAFAIENLGDGSLNRPSITFFVSQDSTLSNDDLQIGTVSSSAVHPSGVWTKEGSFEPESLPGPGEYVLLAQVDAPGEAFPENNLTVRPIEIRETPLLTFDGFVGTPRVVSIYGVSQQYAVRNDHSIASDIGDFTAELRLNDGRSIRGTDAARNRVGANASGQGRFDFSIDNVPVGRHEVVFFQSGVEIGRTVMDTTQPPTSVASIRERRVSVSDWAPGAIELSWTIDSEPRVRLKQDVYWSSDPWLDHRDTLLGSFSESFKGSRTTTHFVSAEEFIGQQGFVITQITRPSHSDLVLDTYSTPITIDGDLAATEDLVVIDVSESYQSPQSREETLVDVWVFNGRQTIESPYFALFASDPRSEPSTPLYFNLPRLVSGLNPGEFRRIVARLDDAAIDYSPYLYSAHLFDRDPVFEDPNVQEGRPTREGEVLRADLRVVEIELPDRIEPGASLSWTVENVSDYPWVAPRTDLIWFKPERPQDPTLASFVVGKSVSEPLLPGETLVSELVVPPDFHVDFPTGFVTVQLGQNLSAGYRPHTEDDLLWEPSNFAWSRVSFQPVEQTPILLVGTNKLSVRLTNEGIVPARVGATWFELNVGNNLNVRPILRTDSEMIEAGESIDVTLEFTLSETVLGAEELRIGFVAQPDTTQTHQLQHPIEHPNFAVSDLRVEEQVDRDLLFRWTVTNVGDKPAIHSQPDIVRGVESGNVVTQRWSSPSLRRVEPAESYEAVVHVPRERLGLNGVVDFSVISNPIDDVDPSDNQLEYRLEPEFIDLGLQSEPTTQNISGVTSIPYSITNHGDVTIDAGGTLTLAILREWQEDGAVNRIQQFEHPIQFSSPLAPGETLSGAAEIAAPASYFDFRNLTAADMRLSLASPWEDSDSSNNSVNYQTQTEGAVVDLAVQDLTVRYVDFDNELVEAIWNVTNVGEVAYAGPLTSRLVAQTSSSFFHRLHSSENTHEVSLEPGATISIIRTFEARLIRYTGSEIEVTVELRELADSVTEGARSNNWDKTALPFQDVLPTVSFTSFEVDSHGAARFALQNDGDLPFHRGFYELYYSVIDDPSAPRERIATEIIELDQPILAGSSRLFETTLDLPSEQLARFDSVVIWAIFGEQQLSTVVRSSPSLEIQRLSLPSWALPGHNTAMRLRVGDDFSGQTAWSLTAHHNGQPLPVVLDRGDQVDGGDFDGVAHLRVPEELANQTLEVEFQIRLEDGSVQDTVTRSLRVDPFDLAVGEMAAEFLADGSHLKVAWSVEGSVIDAFQGSSWTDSIFLSTDAILDPSDTPLASVHNTAAIWQSNDHGDASYERSLVLPLTGDKPIGDRYVIIQANTLDDLLEANLENNVVVERLTFEAPELSIQLAPSSDTGWSNRDGITNLTRPEFVVVIPGAGTLQIDFNGNGEPDFERDFANAGVELVRYDHRFWLETHRVVATFQSGENVQTASTQFEIDRTSPQLSVVGEYNTPLTWLNVVTSEPVFSPADAFVVHREFGQNLTLPFTLEMPMDEFVVTVPEGTRQRYEFLGVQDIAGNWLANPTVSPVVHLESACPFTNPDRFADANGDGSVTARDALFGINLLETANLAGVHRYPQGFADVNCSGSFSPLDPLVVINELARQASAGGEGESVRPVLTDSTRSMNRMPSSKHETAFRSDDRFEPINMSEPPSLQGFELPKQSLSTSSFEGNVKTVQPSSQPGDAETLKDLALADWCDELE